MLNNFLYWYIYPKLNSHQHGYKKGMSITTAWKDVIGKIDSPFIYEFDLKGFFDSVKLKELPRLLNTYSVPNGIRD